MQPRAAELKGSTRFITTGCGKLYTTINKDENGKVYEVFATLGKAGGCASCQNEAIGRLISIALQHGADPIAIVKTLKGLRCHLSDTDNDIHSCAQAVAISLEQYGDNDESGK